MDTQSPGGRACQASGRGQLLGGWGWVWRRRSLPSGGTPCFLIQPLLATPGAQVMAQGYRWPRSQAGGKGLVWKEGQVSHTDSGPWARWGAAGSEHRKHSKGNRGCPPKCVPTPRVIVKALFIKIHFIFKTELSAVKACKHFWGHPVYQKK